MRIERYKTDLLIIGGGAAGLYAGITALENSDINIIIADKANIKRSGCLAAGINALNAYINPGLTEDDYLEYVNKEFDGIVREDLVYTMAKRLNSSAERLEEFGLPILKDEEGNYMPRGKRSIKINGENIKPILAKGLYETAEKHGKDRLKVIEYINISDYILEDNKVIGAIGFSVKEEKFYIIEAEACIIATGGAAGLYRPNNTDHARHKMWYSPFNTGAGYAMGIRAGAEMTSFEMRFIALRCKDTIAPTGTIAQGSGIKHVNAKGEVYIDGKMSTSERLMRTIEQNRLGKGPCYLKTSGIDRDMEEQLIKAYLNMAPGQVIKWIDEDRLPSESNVEIEGTEPYITGGHSSAGYWVATDRSTSLKGLFAAGDVAGGSPKKYATGSFAEGEIAAESAVKYIDKNRIEDYDKKNILERTNTNEMIERLKSFYSNSSNIEIESVEEAMQKVMDEYAGGISADYRYNEERLFEALKKLKFIEDMAENLKAENTHELMLITDIIDRILVSKILINHMIFRKETRWSAYHENLSYLETDSKYDKLYVNSEYNDGEIKVYTKPVIKKGDIYEHRN